MAGKLTRAIITIVSATAAVAAVTAASAAASPSRNPSLKVGQDQHFIGTVNGKLSKAEIRVLCPGLANVGHPLPHQSVKVAVILPPLPANDGDTGTAATSIGAWLDWPASKAVPPPPAYIATFNAYGSMPIPTSIKVPCSGSGQMLFLPAKGSPTVKAATVDVTFTNIGQMT